MVERIKSDNNKNTWTHTWIFGFIVFELKLAFHWWHIIFKRIWPLWFSRWKWNGTQKIVKETVKHVYWINVTINFHFPWPWKVWNAFLSLKKCSMVFLMKIMVWKLEKSKIENKIDDNKEKTIKNLVRTEE